REQKACEQPAFGAQNETNAQTHRAHVTSLLGFALPRDADVPAETGRSDRRLIEPLVAAQSVPADGGGADEGGRFGAEPFDQCNQRRSHGDARSDDLGTPGWCPKTP